MRHFESYFLLILKIVAFNVNNEFPFLGQLSVLEVEVERDKKKKKSGGSSLGIELNGSPVKVTKLHSSSCFLGKLFVGDIIVSINNQVFFKL